MTDENLRLLLQSLGTSIFDSSGNPTGTVAILITETLRFRDKLKEETGQTLTVEDTRLALDALDDYLKGEPISDTLTSEQRNLLQIWIDRLTLFS